MHINSQALLAKVIKYFAKQAACKAAVPFALDKTFFETPIEFIGDKINLRYDPNLNK